MSNAAQAQFSMIMDQRTEAVIIPELELTRALQQLHRDLQGGVRPLHMLGCCQNCGRNRANSAGPLQGEPVLLAEPGSSQNTC